MHLGHAEPNHFVAIKDGNDASNIEQMSPSSIRIIHHVEVARTELIQSPDIFGDLFHALAQGSEKNGKAGSLGNHVGFSVEHTYRKIAILKNYGIIGCAHQVELHLLRSGDELIP